ncbi:hypothetical protein M758_UG307200 [Ceratodon purpureus]|nr:hypothetical protein M758_UG307200 [Ceratodon purpureus]
MRLCSGIYFISILRHVYSCIRSGLNLLYVPKLNEGELASIKTQLHIKRVDKCEEGIQCALFTFRKNAHK